MKKTISFILSLCLLAAPAVAMPAYAAEQDVVDTEIANESSAETAVSEVEDTAVVTTTTNATIPTEETTTTTTSAIETEVTTSLSMAVDPTAKVNHTDVVLTLGEVRQMISDNETFASVYSAIQSLQSVPNVEHGSGLSMLEYWLTEDGSEYIRVVLEQEEIYYVSDGNCTLLFGKPSTTTTGTETTTTTVPASTTTSATEPEPETTTILTTTSATETEIITAPTTEIVNHTDVILTLEEVQQMISGGGTFDSIYNAIQSLQAEPNAERGSGLSLLEYWLTEDGSEYIQVIWETHEIYHVSNHVSGGSRYLMYPEGLVTCFPATTTTIVTLMTNEQGRLIDENGEVIVVNGTTAVMSGTTTSTVTTTTTTTVTVPYTDEVLPQTGYDFSTDDALLCGSVLLVLGLGVTSYANKKRKD